MFGATEIYNALNVSSITNLLDAWETEKALFNDSLIPESFTGKESINFYLSGTVDGGSEIPAYIYSVNCRSETFKKSVAMALAVYTALNRAYTNGGFKVCSILRTIPPVDPTDVYNTPIEIKIITR